MSMARGFTGDRLVVATHNPGKLAEIRALIAPFGIGALGAAELGLTEPKETGTSFIENAVLKARAAAQASGLPALADDSGLVVPALEGAPGIYSARWGGPGRDFAVAMKRVEEQLRGKSDRRAHFVAALALAWPEGAVESFEGTVHGTLIWPPRGEKGFGYDPMFLPTGHARTFGEMTNEEKHGLPPRGKGLSHRARAFLKLAEACLATR